MAAGRRSTLASAISSAVRCPRWTTTASGACQHHARERGLERDGAGFLRLLVDKEMLPPSGASRSHQVGTPKDERRCRRHHFRRLRHLRRVRCGGHLASFYIDWFGRLGDHHTLINHHTLMECPPIDFIGRLQIGRQQALLPLQALDHRAGNVASLNDAMVRQRC